MTHPYRASAPAGSLLPARRFPWLIVVMVLSATFMAGAAVVNQRRISSDRLAMPLICKAEAGRPGRCWDGERDQVLMPGYQEVRMEGGTYLVGWPK